MSVSIIIPWQGGDPDRTRAFVWLSRRIVERCPGWSIALSDTPEAEPWSKSRAIIRGTAHATGDIVIVHDADVWCDGLPEAVAAVAAGYPWAVPHHRVHRLSTEATTDVLCGTEPDERMPCAKRPYRGIAGGGIVVLPAATLAAVPPDPRFVGWGAEDPAWRDALRCLVGMEWRRTRAPLFHLWHPPALDEYGDHRASPENGALAARYKAARTDPGAMRELMAETAVPA